MLIGDWWHLHPPGGIAVMSDPLASKVLESSNAQVTMASLWCLTSHGDMNSSIEYQFRESRTNEQVLQLSKKHSQWRR